MVSTRRSGQRQETTPEPQQQMQESPGPSGTSSQRSGGRSAAGRGRGAKAAAAKKLEPIEEDTAHHGADQHQAEAVGSQHDATEPAVAITQDEERRQSGAAASARDDHAPASQPTTTSTRRGHRAATAPAPAHAAAAATASGRAAASSQQPASKTSQPAHDDSDSEDGSDDDNDDILGPNLMGQLASSLRAALQARAGTREGSPVPEAVRGSGSGAGRRQQGEEQQPKLGLECDPAAIRWQPEVRPAPELVKGPQRVAPGVGAEKEKGLAKKVLAPPRTGKPGDAAAAAAAHAPQPWYKLPQTKITDEVKTELRLLRLRGAYDPKRFYKSFDETKFPKHFQIGTVLDNPTEFYSSRLTARERGASITQEVLADPAIAAARKKRYTKLQAEAHKHQKVKKRKTDLKRDTPKPKRPKH
ncbi:hypothetical protein HYH02_012614 [Chlamydomonas schloesseri]|uniref:Fcf2 pre-rRNA processing C-terminal domain-containing protein n=1 Tax=Chlamydomonas schloesseri TaxID=2026947 RepID=A0A835W2C9_9CHLO|nr:hypothetical protein HYH02_012614 [Chlamydomonas schloesseri]|eukprot:KAG2433496.1 hypothetical protein HYH02_012614 [Chlamydomonas schloesseri]